MSRTVSFTLEDGVNNMLDPAEVQGANLDPRMHLKYKAMVDCRNIDISNAGKGTLRKGQTSVASGSFRCGWSDGVQAFAMRGADLVSFNSSSVSVLQTGFSATKDMVFESGVTMYRGGADTINVVCFTNGEVYGMISGGRVVSCISSDEEFKFAMPPGQCLCEGGGRMYVASGSFIEASEPYDMETRDERFSTIPFDKTVTMIRRANTGVYISTTERVYFHPGTDLTQKDLVQVQTHYSPAITGLSLRVHAEKLGLKGVDGYAAVWVSEDGLCIGTDSGQVVNVSADRVSWGPGKKQSLLFREQNGMAHFIITMQEPGAAKNKFTNRLFT